MPFPEDFAEVKALAEQWSRALWKHLAAYGWRKYLEVGRGALLVPWDLVETSMLYPEALPPGPQMLNYMTLAGAEEGAEVMHARLIRDYDPESQIVLVFIESKPAGDKGLQLMRGRFTAWTMGGEPSPPQAQAQLSS